MRPRTRASEDWCETCLIPEVDLPASMTDAAELVGAIAESSPAMLWMGDSEGRCAFLNAALRRFWGVNPSRLEDFDWSSTLHPDDVEMLGGPFARAMSEHTPFSVQARYRRADGVYRTMRTVANPRFSADGRFLGMTGVNTDITEQLAGEARNRLLMGELNHRTKNILAVVQALARQTAQAEDLEVFLKSFNERLSGLAASNDLLLKNDWSGVWLDDLIKAQLSHLPAALASRIVASGPALSVPAGNAQTLGMALHELSTNSLKYGALSHSEGSIVLKWEVTPSGGWTLEWQERSPLTMKPPIRRGFGQRVIIDMVAGTFGADVTVEYEPPGLRWRVQVPSETFSRR